ncbi:tripartite tricarboxylate transporter substrate binding protein [Variovorax soli]|uniref:Tripartite-type tricarboxylate transporter receptor subunit TctC n=1 Tax=Variovorax soli TaxID=376815 RepID=A0ABU1NI22_9BURK|nr:tripartite tricarboxylate transporter substrate binding protein [Variovorax soli]MDR6538018.1 tripartite-type tricarboxylate transporter receptor subunit TctC [Variovorax soli]
MQRMLKAVHAKFLALASCAIAVAAVTTAAPVHAAFPDKPVKIVVPFAPGGGTDLVARTMGIAMGQELGQPVIIDNKPGAGTIIGTDAVAKSPADGYTLVMATVAHVVNPSLQSKLPYNYEKGFAPVMLVGVSPNVLVVRADSPFKSVRDVIAAAKAHPGKLSFASQGAGTSAHLAGELFKNLTKTDITHIPYRGAGPAITDLLGGQVDIMFATAAAVGTFVESGKLRALAVTTATRSTTPALAKVPTIAESGVPGYVADSWYGLYAPAGTPPDVIARLNAAAKKAVQTEAFRKRVESEGLVINGGSPEEFDRYAKGEEARWRKVVKENRITTD